MDLIEEQRVRLAGMSGDDIAWFKGFDWDPARLPPVHAGNAADFRRRETILNRSIEELTLPERANSPEGRLAAEIGARLADLRDLQEGEVED